jgi:hypothetical protein
LIVADDLTDFIHGPDFLTRCDFAPIAGTHSMHQKQIITLLNMWPEPTADDAVI